LTSQYPWRVSISSRVVMDDRFDRCVVTANTHRSYDHWDYDLTGRFENAFGDPPIFELPSFGGSDSVRGFRADDAIGRRLWADQNELWHALPRWQLLKLATFFDVGGAYQTTGSSPGLREGLGTGLRLDLRVAVLKFDWAYGFGHAATGGSRGKFYFNVVFPIH
jgi:hemolysin activation/secretion protein